eukprot:gene27628-36365_t
MSNIIGYFDKFSPSQKVKLKQLGKPIPNITVRETRFLVEYPQTFMKLMPLLKEIDYLYKLLVPDFYIKQKRKAKQTPFHIENTAFTTVTTNVNYQTAVHTDKGDDSEGFGNLTVIEHGKYKGGETCFPQYGIGVDVRTSDILFMDVHQPHGNLPIELMTPDTKRLSIVCYLRINIWEQTHGKTHKFMEKHLSKEGLVPQRQFISEQWAPGQNIVFLDDDEAFLQCKKNNAYIWGVYPVFNPYFRKARQEMTTHLNYIVGALYGIINRPKLKAIKLTVTKNNGSVLRFNRIGIVTRYYGKEGGLGRFDERIQSMMKACRQLEKEYGSYGHIKVRANGMADWPEFHKYTLKDALNDVIDFGHGKYLKTKNPIGDDIFNYINDVRRQKREELDKELGPDGPRGNNATDSEGNIIQQGNGFKNTNNNWIHHGLGGGI